ncbi:Uncharacterised protein [Mycobacterium tuberculosis]|nr:Uncharacterised protein [Mycobacterium tuberculosis]
MRAVSATLAAISAFFIFAKVNGKAMFCRTVMCGYSA